MINDFERYGGNSGGLKILVIKLSTFIICKNGPNIV